MEITLAGGAVIDLATSHDIRDHHDRLAKLLEKAGGRIQTLVGSGVVGAGASAIQTFAFQPDTPPAGSMWLVQFAVVYQKAANPLAAVANVNAALARGKCPTGPGGAMPPTPTLEITDIVAPFTGGIPGSAYIPDRLRYTAGQQAYVVLTGTGIGAAGTAYVAVCDVLELPDTAEALLW